MKKLLIVLGSVALILIVAFLILDEKLPKGQSGDKAEELTSKMFSALNKSGWDNLPFIRWSFRKTHHYIWDRVSNRAKISWDDKEVYINLDQVNGVALQDGQLLKGSEKDEAIKTAWSYWCNDSFWLIAPFKARDPGTSRKYLKLDDGLDGLIVQYESGGVTPGDAYLWAIDKNGIPQYYKMWVSIIPIGGVKATWSDWKEFEDVKISTKHRLGPMEIPVDGIAAGETLGEIGTNNDLFSALDS